MQILFLLIFVSFLLAGGALASYIWAVSNNQFDDVVSPAQKLVFDDDAKAPSKENNEPRAREDS